MAVLEQLEEPWRWLSCRHSLVSHERQVADHCKSEVDGAAGLRVPGDEERAFLDALLQDGPTRTLDPESADLFLVPFWSVYGPAFNNYCDRARLEIELKLRARASRECEGPAFALIKPDARATRGALTFLSLLPKAVLVLTSK